MLALCRVLPLRRIDAGFPERKGLRPSSAPGPANAPSAGCMAHPGPPTPAGTVEITLDRTCQPVPVRDENGGLSCLHQPVGSYPLVTSEIAGRLLGVIRVDCLGRESRLFWTQAAPMDLDGELLEARIDRRAERWTPAAIKAGGNALMQEERIDWPDGAQNGAECGRQCRGRQRDDHCPRRSRDGAGRRTGHPYQVADPQLWQ